MPDEKVNVISKEVECKWCGAKPGQDCTEGDYWGNPRPLPVGRGHIIRTKEVVKDSNGTN